MSKKMIITFEGIEGSGKTLHINNVARYLSKKKIKFIKLREPGGSINSEKIRKLILNNHSNFNRNTDLLLYLASRSENIEKIILNNYKKKIILIDRFTDSTIAYQHYGMGVSKKFITLINNYLLQKIKINFTFFNIVNEKNLKKRLLKRKKLNRYDKFNYSFYKRVQKGFLKQANFKKKNCLIVDSNIKVSENKKLIIKKIKKVINI